MADHTAVVDEPTREVSPPVLSAPTFTRWAILVAATTATMVLAMVAVVLGLFLTSG